MEFIFAVLLAASVHNDLSNQIDELEEHTAASIEEMTYEIIELDINMTAVHQDINEINKITYQLLDWHNENDATNMKLAASTSSNKALIEMYKSEVDVMQIQLDSLKDGLKNLRDYVTE